MARPRDRPGWSGTGGGTQHGRSHAGHGGARVPSAGAGCRGGGSAPRADGRLAQAGISLPNWALHPPPPSAPHQELRPGPGTHHTHTLGSRRLTHRSSNTGPRGSPTGRAQKPGAPVPPAGGPAGPLTMMASACLASSSETALRKPLGCGAAGPGVGMVPARSWAPLRSPLPGGLLKAEPTSQPLRVPHLPPPTSPAAPPLPACGRRREGGGVGAGRGRREAGLCPIKSNCCHCRGRPGPAAGPPL